MFLCGSASSTRGDEPFVASNFEQGLKFLSLVYVDALIISAVSNNFDRQMPAAFLRSKERLSLP
jgi:hypothetical protein